VVQTRGDRYLKAGVDTYQADLRATFGDPLRPGPPGDPQRFELWREEVEAAHGGTP